ncbi:MAG TPA: hypothetical protein V6D02_05815, partial [Candidatus Obscuribacterales bacterium]
NVFSAIAPTATLLHPVVAALAPAGRLALVETVPRDTQRLAALLAPDQLDANLWARWQAAEAALYADPDDPRWQWDGAALAALLQAAGLTVTWTTTTVESDYFISPRLCDRWFATATPDSYRQRLAAILTPDDLTLIETQVRRSLQNQTVPWRSRQLWLTAVWEPNAPR